MKHNLYDLEEKRLKKEVRERRAKKVLIQLPNGLKLEGPRLAAVIEGAGATAIVSGDPCYGACDLGSSKAGNLKVDLIIHYGHTEMMKGKSVREPIIYFEAKANVNTKAVIEKTIDLLKPWSRIGLTTTVQHIDALDQAKKILGQVGKKVTIGDAGHLKYPGQVLGCDYSNAKSISDKVEAFVFIGGGRFHALGLALAIMKPIIVADPYENRAYSFEDDVQRILHKRWADIIAAEKAKNFGVIIGLKPGQIAVKAAYGIKAALEKSGRKAILIALREITPATLLQFPTLEAYVNTACPRIALDESSSYIKPVLTINESHVMFGKIKWEDLLKEGII